MDEKKLTVIQMLPALESGGVERGTLETAHNLVRLGHRSIVISDGGRLVERLKAEGSEHYCWDVGAKRLGVFFWIRKLRALFTELKPDIVHLRSRLPAWIGYKAWKKMDPKTRPHLVTTMHGAHSVNWYSAIMTRGERVIAISNMIKRYILDNYPAVDEKNIRVVFRGVDRKEYFHGYQPDDTWTQQWYADYPQLQGKYVITLPGRISKRKGLDDFVQVIEKLVHHNINVHGLIVGEPHKRKQYVLDELKSLITEKSLDNDITFTGHRSDLKDIIGVSNAVLSLSLEPEAFGRTTIEALSLGVPVAGYEHGGVGEQLAEILPEGAVPTGDINAVVECLLKWHDAKPFIVDEHEFTLENMLARTLAVYHELAG